MPATEKPLPFLFFLSLPPVDFTKLGRDILERPSGPHFVASPDIVRHRGIERFEGRSESKGKSFPNHVIMHGLFLFGLVADLEIKKRFASICLQKLSAAHIKNQAEFPIDRGFARKSYQQLLRFPQIGRCSCRSQFVISKIALATLPTPMAKPLLRRTSTCCLAGRGPDSLCWRARTNSDPPS